MGIDFTAILDHSLPWDELYDLPDRLNPGFVAPPGLLALLSGRAPCGLWGWDRDRRYSNVAEELFEEGHLLMSGPAGFWATVFRTAIELHHVARWWSFVFEPGVQGELRASAHTLVRLVRGSRIIYAPDSFLPTADGADLLYDGASLDDVLAWFGKSIGPSCAVEHLAKSEDEFTEMGYVVEKVTGEEA